MIIRTSALFALFALGACQGVQIPAHEVSAHRVTPSAAQLSAIKEGVAKSLRDPASAQFGAIVMGESGDGHFPVCGYVNGKNGYGGYSGMTPFLGGINPDGSFGLAGMGGTDIETLSTRQVCAKYGLPI